jgi:2-dehydro-3-deoxyphosphogluconate aldolase/(4S)-4-hydroxy-2-oxoglutarate aldolase
LVNDLGSSLPNLGRVPLPAAIAEGRVIAILRGLEPKAALEVATAVVAGGVRALEVTLNSPDALTAITLLKDELGERACIGAGTVLTHGDAGAAVAAGAEFIVSPNTNPGVISWAVGYRVPALPGAMTPTEVVAAWNAGAAAVKLFPASALPSSYLRELRGPLPDVLLVPTGGVDAETAQGWLSSGAAAVGVGGWLTGADGLDVVERRAAMLAALAVSS